MANKNISLSVFFDHILQAQEQTGKSLSEILAHISQIGVKAVEINLSYLLQHPEILDLLQAADLKISCIYETHNFVKNADEKSNSTRTVPSVADNFSDDFDDDFSDDFAKARLHVDTACKVAAKKILVIPGFLSEKEAQNFSDCKDYQKVAKLMDESPAIQNAKSQMKNLCDYAVQKNVAVTFEDYDFWTSPCSHANQLLWWFKNIPGLKLTFDTGNFLYSKEDVFQAYDLLKPYIAHVHCKDREGDFRCPPVGQGIFADFIAKLIKDLTAQNYPGYFAIEHFDAPDQWKFIEKSVDFLTR